MAAKRNGRWYTVTRHDFRRDADLVVDAVYSRTSNGARNLAAERNYVHPWEVLEVVPIKDSQSAQAFHAKRNRQLEEDTEIIGAAVYRASTSSP